MILTEAPLTLPTAKPLPSNVQSILASLSLTLAHEHALHTQFYHHRVELATIHH